MKKFLFLAACFYLGGCASFGKGVAEAFIESNQREDTRQCEIQGSKFKGIEAAFQNKDTVKILMIHGVGAHMPGYSTRIRENLAEDLGLTVFSRREKYLQLINPIDGKTPVGNLLVTEMQNEDGSKNLEFYELTWSEITNQGKKILNYDVSGKYQHKRVVFNNTMKAFLDDTVPDPMIYLLDDKQLILSAAKQATCFMMSRNWEDLPDKYSGVCKVSSYQQIKDMNKANIIFITHSLGSRILMDSIVDIVQEVGAVDDKANPTVQKIIEGLQQKELTVFMLANQLPLLQIGRKQPEVHNQIPQYCSPKGKNYDKRVFSKVNIVAFSDPNDLLSYDVEQSFVDDYMDSRMCPSLTNVSLNVAEVISAFGVGVVNPVTAHTEYDNDDRVIKLISHGVENFQNDKEFSKKCKFIKLAD